MLRVNKPNRIRKDKNDLKTKRSNEITEANKI